MKKESIVPGYSIVPLIMLLGFNCITYFGTRVFTQSMEHHNIATSLDEALPFVPAFITFYILAYVQWVIGYIVIARESRHDTILLVVFVVFIFVFLSFSVTIH